MRKALAAALCLVLLAASGTALAEKTVTLTFVGDCTLGGEDWLINREGSFHDYARKEGYTYFFEKMRDFFSEDDLTIINFEGVLKDDSRDAVNKTYCFRGPTDFARILPLSSIEAVNLDNNHTLDYGKRGKTSTVEALTGAGVHVFDELTPYIFEKDGTKIAFFGMQRVHFFSLREQLKEQIRILREEEGVNAIIFAQHAGTEYSSQHTNAQIDLAHKLIDMGADFIAGSHPHVVQGMEVYNGRYIFYSMGNFCFGGNSSPSDMDTMIYQQTFTIDADGVKKDNVTNIIPCSISSAAYDGYNNYQPTPAEGDEATRILGKINERSSWISTAEGSTFTAKYNNNNDSQSSSADTAASDSDIVDMNSSASDDTDAETYDESYDTDNSDAE